MKDRIINFINTLDGLSSEITKYRELIDSNKDKILKGDDDSLLFKECFVYGNYISLLYNDISQNIAKLSECYFNSITHKAELNFSKEEQEVLDNYIKQGEDIFVLAEGKIISKTEDLLGTMLKKAEDMDSQSWFPEFKKMITESK